MHRLQKVVYGVIGAAFVLDRLLKMAALKGSSFSLAGDAIVFRLFKNGGIAFSLPASGPIVWVVSIGIIAAMGWLGYRDLRSGRTVHVPAHLSFALGAVSNLYDRVVHGFTVDYLIFFGRSAVNVADGMILAGVLLLLLMDNSSSSSYARGPH